MTTDLTKRIAQAIADAENTKPCSRDECGLGSSDHTDHGCQIDRDLTAEDYMRHAEQVAAALGEASTQWGVEYPDATKTYSDREMAQDYANALQPGGLRQRAVITGEWRKP